MKHQDIIRFWFVELQPNQWWEKNQDFDLMIKDRFADLHAKAALCELFHWRTEPQGRLAEIITLDQFSRNMFRDTAESFRFDNLALALAQEAVAIGADQALTKQERAFLYMPYMHSESRLIHEQALKLYQDIPENLEFEIKHKNIIDRFGRYPHRNKILGRESTKEELAFLQGPNSSF